MDLMTEGPALSNSKVKIHSDRKPLNFGGKRKIFYEDGPGMPNNVGRSFHGRGRNFHDPTKDEAGRGL